MEYDFRNIEPKWKEYWEKNQVYKVSNQSDKPKFYILDMFPYPSGAGLHVGHPLGYIASDIYARYKRLKGFNVLHPMGYDAFGLPAEQYAIETGQHPAITTEQNIKRYREQLDKIGFCFDWSREVKTSDPHYYKWTQWLFLQLFHSWYNRKENKTKTIADLVNIFQTEGNKNHPCPKDESLSFTKAEWETYPEKEKRDILMKYRIAYLDYAEVWWCEALGTVLANDEVVNGVSERGGFPVERKQMRQWFLRITEFANRLLNSLDSLEWTEAMKEMQRNWIGKSNGAEVKFKLEKGAEIEVFTTRPDTIFGVDFMVLAPEHELVDVITTDEQRKAIEEYKQYVKSRSERERMSEVKQITGCFTGAYAIHPFTGNKIPVWISEYVLAGYGTGAIMAVPSGDQRDHNFAKHFNIPITNIFDSLYNGNEAYADKTGKLQNSGFLSGMDVKNAIATAIKAIEEKNIGKRKVNYKLRDAGFSRQRYWGEPFPIIYVDGVPYGTDESPIKENKELYKLPVELPHVDSYKPGPEGQGPLANITDWVNTLWGKRETNTMPGYAGSSWYFLRYMDPHNDNEFASRKAIDYWGQVDIYIGGSEHAVGHLLYSRMWTKAMYDLGLIGFDEPFKKLINQGMIQGSTRFIYFVSALYSYENEAFKNFHFPQFYISKHFFDTYNLDNTKNYVLDKIEEIFSKYNLPSTLGVQISKTPTVVPIRVDVNVVNGNELDTEAFKKLRPEYANAEFIKEDDKYICGSETEKMSKSKYNVVNPDDIVEQYGADTFRMYEMFLGPVEMSKPWDTKGIEGVHRFLKKMWRSYADEQKGWIITDEPATEAELRILHKTLKKISEDIERFAFNTSVSQLMIAVNELSSLNCHKKAILQPLAIAITPFAPHLAEELWQKCLGNTTSIMDATFPAYEEKYVTENSKKYPVSVNGKPRVEIEFPLDMEQSLIEKEVLSNDTIKKWLDGKEPKKIIYVKGKMINVVV